MQLGLVVLADRPAQADLVDHQDSQVQQDPLDLQAQQGRLALLGRRVHLGLRVLQDQAALQGHPDLPVRREQPELLGPQVLSILGKVHGQPQLNTQLMTALRIMVVVMCVFRTTRLVLT